MLSQPAEFLSDGQSRLAASCGTKYYGVSMSRKGEDFLLPSNWVGYSFCLPTAEITGTIIGIESRAVKAWLVNDGGMLGHRGGTNVAAIDSDP